MFNTNIKSEQINLLDSLEIASPCNVDWDSMAGDDRVRHCLQCNKNVYNISTMNNEDVNQFLQATGDKACIRFYRRADGTILLDDCPVGLRRIRNSYKKLAAALTTFLSFAQGFFLATYGQGSTDRSPFSYPSASYHRSNGPPIMGEYTNSAPLLKPAESQAEKEYRNSIKSIITNVLPKNENFGNASVYIFINRDGSVEKARLFPSSPTKDADKLLLEKVRNIKFPSLPSEIADPPLCVLYDCASQR